MYEVLKRWLDRYFADEQAVFLLLLLLAALFVVVSFGVVLAPMFTAIIIAFLMQGLVAKCVRLGIPHLGAVIIAFLVLVSCIVGVLLFLLPAMWKQIVTLVTEAPRMIKQGQSLLLLLPEKYPQLVTTEQVRQIASALGSELGRFGQTVLTFSVAQLPILVGVLIYLVLVPILVFFFLKDSRAMVNWVGALLPKKRPVLKQIWWEMNQQIANYVRGKVVEILIVAGVTSITFTLMGVNYALLLGIVTGVSVLIPYIGAAVATLPVFLIGFFQWGWGSELAWLMIAYGIIQALDGNVLVPLLFSEAVKMHPVAIVLAVLVFGGLWGFWGVFFAIPLATLCKAVINAWPTRPGYDSNAPPGPRALLGRRSAEPQVDNSNLTV